MYTSTATMQSKVSVERGFPILQTELHINMGDCYQHLKLINTPNFFTERKFRKQRKEEFISTDQILY